MNKPNIIIVLAEDICPNLGCYGDKNAKTPRLDEFASENVKFNYCYSVAPVCSAARTSLNLGINGTSAGVGNHRSYYQIPEHIKNFGDYMQGEGYHTVIGKTDFNFPLTSGYHETIHYDQKDTGDFAINMMDCINRVQDKPLFILQTTAITHQSQYGYTQNKEEHRGTMPRLKESEYQIRENMVIPGYHFKSEDADEIWAQYHEKMTAMDKMFGELVDSLKKSETYKETVLIFAGDNGHGIPSGKINLWNEGVHVPMIAHFPKELEKQLNIQETESGKICDRLVSFVDFLTTALSIVDGNIPEYLEGRALVGNQRTPDPEDVYCFGMRVGEVFENSRSVYEKDLMYTCDFGLTPYCRLNAYQTVQAPWFVRSMIEEGYKHNIADVDRRALFRQIPRVTEQLFDLEEDEYSLVNCAKVREEDTLRMRKKMYDYIVKTHDSVWIPEALITEIMEKTSMIPYEILHDEYYYPIESLKKLWDAGIKGKTIPVESENPCEKIWITKFLNDRGEIFDRYLYDESEVVSAYTAYRVGDVKRLEEIARRTQNCILVMFIVDMISNTYAKEFQSVYQVIGERDIIKIGVGMSERFTSSLDVGIDMLALRIDGEITEDMKNHGFWITDKHKKARMVLDELDL